MVVANSIWPQDVSYYTSQIDDNLNVLVDTNKMSAKGILICRDNSHVFQDRTLNLDQAVKIGRSVARTRAAADNAIFDCKVLSRNHALLWYNAGKFYLRDTRSSNGTFVNNQRLSATGFESAPKEVCSGDIVQFGVDVVESTKKVTHGCIIATLKLYLPDGKEAKASRSMHLKNPARDVTLVDLYKLSQYIEEANRRESVLNSKLLCLQKLVTYSKRAAGQSWKALIEEDRLLSRVKTVESQLIVYSKNYSEDKIRSELVKLEEEKSQYQIAAKEALHRVHQEKLEISQKLIQLESRLSDTEEECQSLHDISKHAQEELQQLAAKYTSAQKNLVEFEEKLAAQEQKSHDIVKWAVQDKQDLIKKVKHQSKIGRELQSKLIENRLDSVKIHKKLTGLKNYMQTLQDLNAKFLSDESKDGVNPIEAINAILDTLNEMIANNDNINDFELFENLDNMENSLDIEDNQSKLHDIDSNQKISLHSERSSYDKNELDDSNNDCDNFAAYILPPTNPRRTLINGKVNIDEHNQGDNSDINNDDTSSVISDTDTQNYIIDTDDFVDKSIIESKLETGISTDSLVHSDIDSEHQVQLSNNENYYNLLDINNRNDGDESSDSADSPNESVPVTISTIKNNNSTVNQNKNDAAAEHFENDENLSHTDSVDLNIEKIKRKECNAEKEFEDRKQNEEKNTDDEMDEKNIDDNETMENTEKIGKNENYDIKEDSAYIKTLKPQVKNFDNSSQYSNTKDYILHLFMSSLESLKGDDDFEAQQLVKQELDEFRNWLINESNDVIMEKLREHYYRAKNDNTRIQEMAEELVILKEKYSSCHDEKTELWKKYITLKTQCGDVLNASYSVPIQYFVPVAIAFLWMLFEHLF
ncbi:hypothetical protein PV327_004777 [Microctonus hyperodae]|uniref:Sarcolemmal membrane-associated protein n=1 Tax=Microctonus hyperodae TaxID=165561 RepID=A0AA39FD65_MICHY|nr:hypothetical protein PV327_004777 [Microctonus hyperodae]